VGAKIQLALTPPGFPHVHAGGYQISYDGFLFAVPPAK
jgi:hypothetical protein